MDFFGWISQINYLAWLTIGLIFVISELFVPGMYLLWFGFSSCTMGLLVLFINFTISKVSSLMLVVSEYRVLIYGISFIK